MLSACRRVRARTRLVFIPMRHHSFDIRPPQVQRGLLQIDRDAFRKEIPVLAARVPAAKAGLILRAPETKKCEQTRRGCT
jgi:hypothetical protein